VIRLLLYQLTLLYTTIASCQFNTIKDAAAPHLYTVVNKLNDTCILKDTSLLNEKNMTEVVSMLTDNQSKELRFFAPLRKVLVTSVYGVRYHPILGTIKLHAGIDLKARYEAVFAIANGIVTFAGYGKKEGNYLIVEHNNIESFYLHLSVLLAKKGDIVKGGSCIGISGNSGITTGPHLHFGMRYYGQPVNPEVFLKNIRLLNE